MTHHTDKKPLLDSFRVLDLSDEKGAFCAKILGDLGADVIKIERPGGDRSRHIGPFYHDDPDPEKSLSFMYCNTSKRGITLDIEKQAGQEVYRRLLQSAHFVIESFTPGRLDALDIGYEAAATANPGIVFTSITPFGQSGPYSKFKGSDIVLWAMGGMMAPCGEADRAPLRCTIPQAYYFGSLHAAAGSLVAHYERQQSGLGQHVDVSIQEAVLLGVPNAVHTWDLDKRNPVRSGGGTVSIRPGLGVLKARMLFPCRDGRVVCSLGGGGVGWTDSSMALTKLLAESGMAEELESYDWGKYNAGTITQQQRDRIEQVFEAYFKTRDKQDLFEHAVTRGFSLAPSSTAKDIIEDRQLEARQFFASVEHPELDDTLAYAGAPIKMGDHSWEVRRRAPHIGEHNAEVYGELGLSPREQELLQRQGVI